MQIDFLYFADCPSHEPTLERLKAVMSEEGVQAEIKIIEVDTSEQAQQHQFIGSPTIRVNGHDIAPIPDDAQYELACRVYHLPEGRFSPMPSVDMIRNALTNQSN